MDTIDQLMQRITQNLADYHAEIKQFNKQAIIDMAGRISAMNDAHYYLTENHAFTYEDAEYLLKFKNPLEIVADKWETRISDLSDMSFDLDKIFYDKEAENNGYELAGADADAPAVDEGESEAPKKPTVLDRRLAEHEFTKGIQSLLPDSSSVALTCWINYGLSLEFDGKQAATQCFSELTAALAAAKQQYGEEIATQVFHVALEMPIPVSDIPGAAAHLQNGGDINDIIDLSLDGELQSAPVMLEQNTKDAPTAPAQTITYVPPLSEAELKEVTLKEAERLVAELKALEAPNDPDGKYYTAQVSDAFLKQAGFYPEQLLTHAFVNADTLLFGNTPDGKGIYLSVSGDVRDSIGVKGVAPPVMDKPVDVQAEAERIITEIKTLTGPNSPNKTHYAIQVSRDFMNNAGSSDTGKLLKALPFKNTALTNLNGLKGIFVTIPKGEVQKPSLLGRLDAAKKDAAAQNQPPGADKSKKVNRGDR